MQSAFYSGYFLGAIPAGRFSQLHGFKQTIVLGLTLFSSGSFLFYPAALFASYSLFLASLAVEAFGLAFLECAANPFVPWLAEGQQPGSGTRMLNLAQAFNPLGSIMGVYIGREFILDGIDLSDTLRSHGGEEIKLIRLREARAVGPPYVALGGTVVLIAASIVLTKFPVPTERPITRTGFWTALTATLRLGQNKMVLLVSDNTSIQTAYCVPACCFVIVGLYGWARLSHCAISSGLSPASIS